MSSEVTTSNRVKGDGEDVLRHGETRTDTFLVRARVRISNSNNPCQLNWEGGGPALDVGTLGSVRQSGGVFFLGLVGELGHGVLFVARLVGYLSPEYIQRVLTFVYNHFITRRMQEQLLYANSWLAWWRFYGPGLRVG